MKGAIMYLPYLPNVNWMYQLINRENILIEREENFVKSSFRNRSEIVGANGRQLLSIPLQGGRDKHQKYSEVKVDYSSKWNTKHWQSIKTAYGSAPFFEHYAGRFEAIFLRERELLFEFNTEILKVIFSCLKINASLVFTEEYHTEPLAMDDLRLTDGVLPEVFYHQVFADRLGFVSNLSIIDAIFNLGPQTIAYLKSLPTK